MVIVAFWIKIKKTQPVWKSLVFRLASLVVSVALIALVATFFYKDYASLFRNDKELVKSLSPSNSIVASYSYYSHHKLDNLPLVKIGEDAKQNPKMLAGPKKTLTILVLGETSRADNFSLSGYNRDTNPLLAKDNVFYFPHTTSCGTATAVSVPCMFSNMPRAHYDEELASHQEGLLDVIQRAGINVLWKENDGGCKGACDRVPHEDVTSLDLPGMCIEGECHDEILFNKLEDYIKNLKGNGVIVLHTIGSHGPTYYHRYPASFRKFTPTCDTNEIQTCSSEQLVNTYDNTILYIDYIVDKAITVLKQNDANFTTSLVYLSDHGESLGESGVYLHGMPYAIAPVQQKHVPMLIWLSEDYKKRFGINESCLKKAAANNNYSQDNLFSTMLGLTGTETKEYVPSDDILASCR
jgi:lipid A ethanolaminephosphotransferase